MKKPNFKRSCSIAMALALSTTMIGGTGITAFANIADNLDPDKKYTSEFGSYEEYLEYAAQVNVDMAGEGFVLLKNKETALPFAAKGTKVTVFGSGADSLVAGGGGSGSQSRPSAPVSDILPQNVVNVLDSLRAAGYEVNPAVENIYKTVNSVQMPQLSGSFGRNSREGGKYMDITENAEEAIAEFAGNYYKASENCSLKTAEESYKEYGDAAVVVISRSGSEGADNPTNNVAGHTDIHEHYQELDDAEKELMAYAKANFDKVIVIINSPSAMELGCLEYDDEIDAMLWIGQPGFNGALAIGKIFNGEVNPSAKTVDFYMADFTTDPTWYNFGNYTQANYAVNNEYGKSTSTVVMNGAASNGQVRALDYAEGIYMGYRYYETVAVELGEKGEKWYQENTVYSFGHGLSYTTFEQEIVSVKGDINSKEGEIAVTVKVTNTGDVAGKDVVQLYVSKPYTVGGIEKAAIDLVDFGKTAMLAPGASQELTITVSTYDMASFDYNDANANEFYGWELEKGDYVFSIRADSHKVLDTETVACTTASTWDGDEDEDTPNAIYSQTGNNWEQFSTLANNWTTSGKDHYLTRDQLVDEDGNLYALKNLAWLLTEDNDFKDETFAMYNSFANGYAYRDWDNFMTTEVETDYVNPWNIDEVPEDWTQGAGVLDANGNYAITLYEMKGVALDDAKWTEFMNQLTWEEMILLNQASNGSNYGGSGGYGNSALPSINKPWVNDSDGPGQLKDDGVTGMAWVCEVVQASTWNKELCYEQGRCVGLESMYINSNGWYGPALNTHRSPFAGRNFEYFSQDGVQGGLIAAAVVKGYTDMGGHVYAKHAFLNDQETNREKTATFATEQAMREIYAKQFELTVTEGNCNGFMNAFNRIGVATSASYATGIVLYDQEWGFDGFSVTDYWGTNYASGSGWTGYQMVRGMTMPLNKNTQTAESGIGYDGIWDAEKNMVMVGADKAAVQAKQYTLESPTQWYYVRMAAQRLLYTVVNSNALKNGLVDIEFTSDLKLTQYEAVGYQNLFDANTRKELMKFFGTEGYEIVKASNLPSGLSIVDGFVTGTPTAAGTKEVTLTIKGLGNMSYINALVTFNLTVAEGDPAKAPVAAPTVAIAQGTLWTETEVNTKIYTAALGQNVVVEADAQANAENLGKITKYNVAAELPEGLELAADGTVTGKAAAAGSYNVSVTVTYTEITQQNSSGNISYRTQNRTVRGTITLEVVEGAMGAIEVVDGYWFINGVNTGIPVTGADGVDGMNGKPGIDGMPGINGTDGKDGVDGVDGKDGVGIATIIIENGVLTITLTDGTVVSANVTGPQGPQGEQGVAGANGQDALAAMGCANTISGLAVASTALAVAAFVLRKKEN